MDANLEFDTYSESIFGKFLDSYDVMSETSYSSTNYNFCDNCRVPCELTSGGYECPQCGSIKENVGQVDEKGSKSFTKCGGKKMYNIVNYTESQKKQIKAELEQKNKVAPDNIKIPQFVINEVVEIYNDIQKIVIEQVDNEGKVCNKKLVNRGGIKGKIIGVCIGFVSAKHGCPMKEKNIAKFMGCVNEGLSQGKKVIRKLHNMGKINMPIDGDIDHPYIEKYLTNMGLYKLDEKKIPDETSLRYKQFVNDFVEIANKNNVGTTSVITTKIVGAIYILCNRLKLQKTYTDFEKLCDIRVNTFSRFVKLVESPDIKLIFMDAFVDNYIPHGINARLVRVKN